MTYLSNHLNTIQKIIILKGDFKKIDFCKSNVSSNSCFVDKVVLLQVGCNGLMKFSFWIEVHIPVIFMYKIKMEDMVSLLCPVCMVSVMSMVFNLRVL